jgi:type I restriction enzyme S subunit
MDTKKLRQKILDLAIHGKLVPQDPNDEPASVLLERIKAEKERLVKEGKIKRSKKSAKTSDTPHYGNVPFEIPDNWVWCRLEDIANIGTGATPNRLNKEYYNNGIIPWINSSSTNCTYITEASEYITEKAINETNCKIYPIGTLIVAMYGEGKTRGQVSELLIESATNQACAAISLIDTNIKAYIKNYFEGNYFHLRKLAEGGNQPNLSIGKISNYTIPLPPLSEQHRITTEIEKCFSIIDIIECGKADLQTAIKQAKSKILDLAIHGKLVPQDPNDEPAIELLKRINPDFTPCDNGHYAQLPDGWCAVALKDLCENINGLWKGKKEPFVNVGVIRNANFTKDFKLDYSNIEYIDVEQRTFAKRHLENGDLIVEKSGGSDNNPVGRTILYEGKSGVFSFSNFTMALRTRNNDIVLSKFLYYYILAKYQKGDMRLMQTQTTGLRNLILDKFLSMPIHLPPLSEQKRIIDRIETIFTSLDMIMGSL